MTRPRRLPLVCLLAACLGLAAAGCGSTIPRPGKDEVGYLKGKADEPVFVSEDIGTHDQLLAYVNTNRNDMVQGMIAKGRVITCDRGTWVKVVKPGTKMTTVHITHGPHSGKTGIVSTECVFK